MRLRGVPKVSIPDALPQISSTPHYSYLILAHVFAASLQDAIAAVAYCENKKVQDLADAKEAERLARAKEIEEEKEKRISAFEMLSSY